MSSDADVAPPEPLATRGSPDADAGPAPAAVRAFLIADIRGYTTFTRQHGDAAAARLAGKFAGLARDAVEARGGLVLELRGDEALAVFDRAGQAVRAAVELQATCAEESEEDPSLPFPIGVGLDAGEAVPVEGGFRGVAINMAARLCSKAAAAQILATRGLVELAGPVEGVRYREAGTAELKGFEGPVDLIEVVGEVAAHLTPARAGPGIGSEPPPLPPELDQVTPLVNRMHELHWLRGTWRQARRGRGRVVFVSGPVGIGKKRLCAELAGELLRDGVAVRYAGSGGAAAAEVISAIGEATLAAHPTLIVLSDLDVIGDQASEALAASFDLIEGRPVLVVGLLHDEGATPRLAAVVARGDARGDGHRRLGPLDAEGVRDILRLYAGEDGEEAPVESMLRASGGVPGRVHEVVSTWSRDEANRRVEAAVEWLASGHGKLQAGLDFANNVIGLRLARLYGAVGAPGTPTMGGTRCPYQGLASFGEQDAAYFFGRELLVGELAARLAAGGLLGVIGPSGSGKSSAVCAGLLPSLSAGLLPGSERWRHAVIRPGEHPMAALRHVLGARAEEDVAGAGQGAAGDDPLAPSALRIGSHERLILVVDQFEELFTLCADESERQAFVTALTGAAVRIPARIGVVTVLRADFYGNCATYPELAELLGTNHVLVGPMTRDELHRAIELPARRTGLHVESGLADALVAEVADEPGGLPLLSTTLVELWEQRDDGWLRADSFERTGGVRRAVARLAESAFEQLEGGDRELARKIFLRLTGTGDGDAVVRRRAPISEFDIERDPGLSRVLSALTERRLLTMSDGMVEVAHEALLREWPRLRGWLDEDVQGRQLRRHLTQVARQWEESGRDQAELYRGARLSVALDWAATHGRELNELERDFLSFSRKASEAEAERQRRTNRRLRGLLVGVAAFLVIALVAGSLALVQRGRAQAQRTRAEAAAVAAEAQRLGAQSLVEKSPDLSLLLARQAVALNDSEQTRSTLLAALLRWQGAIRVIRPNGNRLLTLAVSPTNNWVAFSDNDNTTFVYDARTFRKLRTISGFVDGLAASRDGRWLFVANAPPPPPGFSTGAGPPPEAGTETIRAYDVSTGAVEWTAHGASAGALQLSPDGRLLAWVTDPDPHGGKAPVAAEFRSSDGSRVPIRLPRGFRGFAFAGVDRAVTSVGRRTDIVDLRTGRVLQTFALDQNGRCCAVSADASVLAVAQSSEAVRIVNLDSGRTEELVSPIALADAFFAFSPDGSTLAAAGASGGSNGVVVTWDLATGSAQQLRGHTGNVTDIGFSEDGRTMYTDGLDGTAVVWDLAGDRGLRRPFDAHDGGTAGAPAGAFLPYFAFAPDGRTLAVTGHVQDHVLRFLDSRTLALTGELPKDSSVCCGPPSFDARGDRLATVDGMGVYIWDVATKTLIRRLYSSTSRPSPQGPPPVDAIAFSPEGTAVVANDQKTVLMLDAGTGRIERRFSASAFVEQVLFSPRGDLMAAWDDSHEVTAWDVRSGRQLWRVNVGDQPWLAALSERYFAIGTSGGLVLVFQARTGRAVGRPFVGDACFVLSVAFNPVTGVLASTGCDGTATLTDPTTAQAIGSPLPGSAGAWSVVGWDPTGTRLALVGNDGTGFMWDMSLSSWEARACRTSGRTLTRDEWRQFLPDRPYRPACG